jgi:tRNA threonylcarbamoyladenosine biosynthesis protein TsaB
MVKLLAIETSAEACSVALFLDGESREIFEHAPKRHAELLLPSVRSLLSGQGLSLKELDAIAFGRGPGSFTGLRIGIGVVQGLAWGGGLPVVPVSSLAAVAQEAVGLAVHATSRICVALDARMEEVYTGDYRLGDDGLAKPLGAERVCPPAMVEADTQKPFIAAGNGFDRYLELKNLAAKAAECRPGLWPRAEMIGKLALGWLETNEPLPAAMAQPVYLRNEVAVKPAKP